MKLKIRKIIKKLLLAAIIFAACVLGFVVFSNLWMVQKGKAGITSDETKKEMEADCILILGAGVWSGNRPSPMLADRLEEGIRLYREGIAEKILVSGDHGRVDYDEVNVMKKYLMDAGIPSQDIFMDHAGFSTYESMYRARDVFQVKKLIVVTQEYHMYRALYICERLGLEALGSPADPRLYAGAFMRNARELIARDKDIVTCLFGVKPKYLGDVIDIHGDGDVTNDKKM